jgi:capsular polysaccharide biosynthesis protein
MYRASATFAVDRRLSTSTGNDSYGYSYDYGTVSQLTDTFPYIVSSDLLMDVVADEMGTPYVYANIYSSGVEDTNLFSIYVEAADPDYAYSVLNSVISNYPKVAEYVIGDTQLSMLIDPVVPDAPVNDSQTMKYLGIGALAGFVVGMGILFLMAYLNNSVKTIEDISKMLNQTPLGIVPHVATRKRRSSSPASVSILGRSTETGLREASRAMCSTSRPRPTPRRWRHARMRPLGSR